MKTSPNVHRFSASTTVLFAAVLAVSSSTYAQTALNWLGGNGTNGSWGATGNFNAAFVSSNQTDLTFGNMTRATTNSYGASRTVRSITFTDAINNTWTTATTNSTVLTFGSNTGEATLNVNSGATGNISFTSVGTEVTGRQTLSSNLTVNHNGSGSLTFGRQTDGAGGITKTGAGTFVITGFNANSFTGALNVNGGRFVLNNTQNATADLAAAVNIGLGGGTLEMRTSGAFGKTLSQNMTVSSASTLAYNNTTDVSQAFALQTGTLQLNANLTAQNISSNGTLANQYNISRNLTGSGDLIVRTNLNVISGDTLLTNGRVQLSGNNSAWTGNLVIARGSSQINGAGGSFGGNITIGTSGDTFGAGLGFNNGNNDFILANAINVETGGARLIRNNSGPSTGSVTLNGAINLLGNVTLDHGGNGDGKSLTANGNISGLGGIIVTRLGQNVTANTSVVLTGNNSYSGATIIGAEGKLVVNSASGNAIGNTSAVTLNGANATLTITTAETIGSLASSGVVGGLVLTNSLTTGGNNQSTTYGGNSTGAGGLTKQGSGTMTLSGTNAYSGATNVSAGTLLIDTTGSINSTSGLTVASGATFRYNSGTAYSGGAINNDGTISGTGTLNVAVTLDSLTDVLAPGNSPGVQNFGGAQTWNSFTYAWEINNFTGTNAGVDFDRVTIGGALDLTGGSGAYVLNILSLDQGTNLTGDAANFSENSFSWTVLSAGGPITGFNAANWTIVKTGFTNAELGTFVLSQNGNNLDLTYTPIPEPSSYALIGAVGALGLVATRRRRRLAA